jgi:acyl-CoA synthetase (AMP-forming)/AMP-acid ligase II/acyl carrier protein
MTLQSTPSVAQLLQVRAQETPDGGYHFLRDGALAESIAYPALDQDARSIAAQLQAAGVERGAPVLLLYPPGLAFVRAFFGSLYAGATAVPVYPPNPARLARTLPRLRTIAIDSVAKFVMTTKDIHEVAEAMFPLAPELVSCTWLAIDGPQTGASTYRPPSLGATDLALLQYTSGSTREPHGVMLTHGNLLHNQGLIREAFQHRERELKVVSWLPVYHDMGLIGMVLQPLYMGGSCTMMSPLDFFQSPFRWLSAISEHKATTSGAPNFAYDLCVRKISDDQVANLDLSSWRVAYCGAEPVRASTLERFTERFARAGFKASSLLPCYGLAEATLIVSGKSRVDGFVKTNVDEDALRSGTLTTPPNPNDNFIVGCGPAVGDQEVVITGRGTRLPAGRVGEIWVRGGSVGQGYWGRQKESAETFGARLSDGTGPFLRTGDLGALGPDGELYVVGRSKDVLIVRGLNYYPHDIEATVEAAWPGLRPGCTAALALEGREGDEVAVVTEYDAREAKGGVAWDAVVDAIGSAVAAEHEVALRAIAIVAAGQVPKTPSGKLQRSETRRRLLVDELTVLHRWDAPDALPAVVGDVPLRTAAEITAFLTSWLSEGLGRTIKPTSTFASIGLDSLGVVRLMEALSERLGVDIDPALALDYPSIEVLAAHIAEQNNR